MGKITVSGKEYDAKTGSTICDSMSSNGFHPDSYLYLIDGKPVPMDTVVSDETVVKAMRVASGG